MTDPRGIWQNQPEEDPMLVRERLHRDMTRHHLTWRWENRIAYIALAFTLVLYAAFAYGAENATMRIGAGIAVGAVIFAACGILSRGEPKEAPLGLSLADGVAFMRSELARKRDLMHWKSWGWFFAMLTAGVALFFVGEFKANPSAKLIIAGVVGAAFVAIGFVGNYFLSAHRMNRLQKQIDALPRVDEV